MSQQLINRSPDLQQLRDEGYDVEVRDNYLVLKNIPYVNASKEIKFGMLVSNLSLAGNVTTRPTDHVAYFAGEYPCNKDGTPILQIHNQSMRQVFGPNLAVDHTFSSKPSGGYNNYYEKMTTYATIIASPAQSLDPTVSAKTFPAIAADVEESVFHYIDTASSRAGISMVSQKLERGKIAIVGLGGTGSYVLDLVAKTPVREIHLFDGDVFSQHNAFRSPGAPSIEDLQKQTPKAVYFQELYSRMHRQIFAHVCYIDESNVSMLADMEFVFLCLDKGTARKLIIENLEAWNIAFIDVGMGLYQVDDALAGVLRITTSTPEQRGHVRDKNRIPLTEGDNNNEYTRNIQIADLNALNATLAVIKWKKLLGFYLDLEKEHNSTYTIDGNMLTNEDHV